MPPPPSPDPPTHGTIDKGVPRRTPSVGLPTDWDYVAQCARDAPIPTLGSGDVYQWTEWYEHRERRPGALPASSQETKRVRDRGKVTSSYFGSVTSHTHASSPQHQVIAHAGHPLGGDPPESLLRLPVWEATPDPMPSSEFINLYQARWMGDQSVHLGQQWAVAQLRVVVAVPRNRRSHRSNIYILFSGVFRINTKKPEFFAPVFFFFLSSPLFLSVVFTPQGRQTRLKFNTFRNGRCGIH